MPRESFPGRGIVLPENNEEKPLVDSERNVHVENNTNVQDESLENEEIIAQPKTWTEFPAEFDLIRTPEDRTKIRAIQNINKWEREEQRGRETKKNTFARIKNWFSGDNFEDDRTLQERMAEIESGKILEEIREKLSTNPASLTKQDLVLLSDAEMAEYESWKSLRR